MFTNQEADRLERQLRAANAQVKAGALDEIVRMRPDDRAALLAVHNTAYSPRLLGMLLALEQGATIDAPSLDRVAIETLARALGGRDEVRRRAACMALVHGNVPLAAAQPTLVRLARDRRARVRGAVGDILSWGSWLETDDVGLVERMLRDPWLRIAGATTAAHLLERLLKAMTAALARPKGRSLGRSIPPITRANHVHALVTGLGALPELGSGLVAALAARDPGVRRAAARGLESIAASTRKATAPLLRALGDREARVSDSAFMALRALERVIEVDRAALRRMLRSKRPHVRANSVRVLPFARTRPPIGWDLYMRALDDPAAEVQSAAAQTLPRRFGEVPPELLARLRHLATSPALTSVRMDAAHSVAHLARDAEAVKQAVASLIEGLRTPDTQVRRSASSAIICLGNRAVSALPDLLRLAKSDPEFGIRCQAIQAFRSMGPSARAAVPLLEELLQDPKADIRRFAGQALAAVQARTITGE